MRSINIPIFSLHSEQSAYSFPHIKTILNLPPFVHARNKLVISFSVKQLSFRATVDWPVVGTSQITFAKRAFVCMQLTSAACILLHLFWCMYRRDFWGCISGGRKIWVCEARKSFGFFLLRMKIYIFNMGDIFVFRSFCERWRSTLLGNFFSRFREKIARESYFEH